MRQVLEAILDKAVEAGASYADVRHVTGFTETISVKNRAVESMSHNREEGTGIRVLVDGAWGFASTCDSSATGLSGAASLAVQIARASARWKKARGVELSPLRPVDTRWRSPAAQDPFDVPSAEKISLLTDTSNAALSVPGTRIASATMTSFAEQKLFMSTEGSCIEQHITGCGATISVLAHDQNGVQTRSFSDFESRGYEFVRDLDLKPRAETLAGEAVNLLGAETCPRQKTDLVMGGSMVALQIHESCGHPIELDRVMGQEATFAGTSFLTLDKRESFMYGSPSVTITADATIDGGLGSFGYDDEGVHAQRTVIIDKGRFVNYLTSRETAAMFGQTSNGTMRAAGWSNIPLIRMTNINLEPGDWTLDEIIRDTKQGVFVDTPKSWSLDDKRLNFHFGQEIAYEIKDGSIGKMLKNPAHTAMTPQFWNACDAVANKQEWKVWGTPGCAKGEPVQVIHVGHGASPARFRGIRVGVGE